MTAAWRLINPYYQSFRMYIASLGFSKFCFLLSLAFCGFLLLLIPVLRPPACQVDLPQPRPQVRPAQTDPSLDAWFLEVSKSPKQSQFAKGQERNREGKSEITRNAVHKRTTDSKDSIVLGKVGVLSGLRTLESLELKDIFIAVKTTKKYHRSRLQLLIQTWISQAKEQVRLDY